MLASPGRQPLESCSGLPTKHLSRSHAPCLLLLLPDLASLRQGVLLVRLRLLRLVIQCPPRAPLVRLLAPSLWVLRRPTPTCGMGQQAKLVAVRVRPSQRNPELGPKRRKAHAICTAPVQALNLVHNQRSATNGQPSFMRSTRTWAVRRGADAAAPSLQSFPPPPGCPCPPRSWWTGCAWCPHPHPQLEGLQRERRRRGDAGPGLRSSLA